MQQISEHLVRVYSALSNATWPTCHDLAETADVAPRTARHHAVQLWQAGLADRREMFGGYRYNLLPGHDDYRQQMHDAARVLGLDPATRTVRVRVRRR